MRCFSFLFFSFLMLLIFSSLSQALYVEIKSKNGTTYYANINLPPIFSIRWVNPLPLAETKEIEKHIKRYIGKYKSNLMDASFSTQTEHQQDACGYELTYQPGHIMLVDEDCPEGN
ncbi:hypothetical protein ACH42_08715 [Endozoicomonas sp. (ex Bugula neritina AB1)]|nr:hypothetical protein ACH42_08715 [Endozoicomonas sp. (ex Bugula neritina AB1)]